MGNLLIYSAAEIFCIWPRALPRCRPCLGLQERKPIRRGRCVLSLATPLVARATSPRACWVSDYRNGSVSSSSSRTGPGPAPTLLPSPSSGRRRTATPS